jgi:hypothetical protein
MPHHGRANLENLGREFEIDAVVAEQRVRGLIGKQQWAVLVNAPQSSQALWV